MCGEPHSECYPPFLGTLSLISGVVFLDKPSGMTSRQAVDAVRRIYSSIGDQVTTGNRKNRLKAGHAGTLDPLATGMLPILLGETTRFADLGLQADKSYEVVIDLSLQTDALDIDGEVVATYQNHVDHSALLDVLKSKLGIQQQTPPQYSAIRIQGQRAYTLARKGIKVDIPSREIKFHQLECLSFDFPICSLRVHCSKGTYIRSLARDIGEELQLGGCVRSLRRLTTGSWPASMMSDLDTITNKPLESLFNTSEWLREWPKVQLELSEAKRFIQGQRIALNDIGITGRAVVYSDSRLLGMAMLKLNNQHIVVHPEKVLPSIQKIWENK